MVKANIFVLYKRILLTRNKKNYAGLITGELGRLLDRPVLDIKGKQLCSYKISLIAGNPLELLATC